MVLPYLLLLLTCAWIPSLAKPSTEAVSPKIHEEILLKDEYKIIKVDKNGGTFYGVVNHKNKEIIPVEFKRIHPISSSHLLVTNIHDKIALYNTRGTKLTAFEFDVISSFDGAFYKVEKNGKKGLINKSGIAVIPASYKEIYIKSSAIQVQPFPIWKILSGENEIIQQLEYDEVKPIGEHKFLVVAGNQAGIIDEHKNFISPVVERSFSSFKDNLSVFKLQDKSGVVQDDGKVILQPLYDSIFIAGKHLLAMKRNKGDNWTMFDLKGDSITRIPYQNIKKPQEGYFPIKRNGSWGFINEKGEEIIPNQYDTVESFIDSMAKAKYVGSSGVIDKEGVWVIRPWKDQIEDTPNNVFFFKHGTISGLIIPGNQEIYQTEHEFVQLNSGFLVKDDNGKFGLISHKGKKLLPIAYDFISGLQEDSIYIFRKDSKYGIITKNGKILVKPQNNFQELYPLSEGYMGVKINDKYGFVDMNGALRIANRYEGIGDYKNGMAPIKLLGKWGYIDKIERLIVQPYYDKAFNFSDGMAIVMKNKKYGLVSRTGKEELPLLYDTIVKTPSKKYMIYKDNQAGLVNEKGSMLISPKYDQITDLNNGYVIIERNGKFGLVTVQGVNTIPLIYETLIYDEINDLYLVPQKQEEKRFSLDGALLN